MTAMAELRECGTRRQNILEEGCSMEEEIAINMYISWEPSGEKLVEERRLESNLRRVDSPF